MTRGSPTFVQLSPPEVIPPTCRSGPTRTTDAPRPRAATAAVTPAAVAPKTTTSAFTDLLDGEPCAERLAQSPAGLGRSTGVVQRRQRRPEHGRIDGDDRNRARRELSKPRQSSVVQRALTRPQHASA